MNSKTWTRIIALTLLAVLAVPVQLAAQDEQRDQHMHHHYKLIDMGTFGGPNTISFTLGRASKILNNRGMATGAADTLPRLWLSKAAFGVSQAKSSDGSLFEHRTGRKP